MSEPTIEDQIEQMRQRAELAELKQRLAEAVAGASEALLRKEKAIRQLEELKREPR